MRKKHPHSMHMEVFYEFKSEKISYGDNPWPGRRFHLFSAYVEHGCDAELAAMHGWSNTQSGLLLTMYTGNTILYIPSTLPLQIKCHHESTDSHLAQHI